MNEEIKFWKEWIKADELERPAMINEVVVKFIAPVFELRIDKGRYGKHQYTATANGLNSFFNDLEETVRNDEKAKYQKLISNVKSFISAWNTASNSAPIQSFYAHTDKIERNIKKLDK